MTSVVRTYVSRPQGLTRFLKAETPTYTDSGIGGSRIFPFSYSNGVLDISYSGNTFKADMVDTPGQDPADEPGTAVQIMGSPKLVTSLGDNFKAYIRAWRTDLDPGSPIDIYIKPQVIRVQEADRINIDSIDSEAYKVSTNPPASDTFPAGNTANLYRTAYVFRTPLTIRIKELGVTQYMTFRTAFDQE